MILNRERLSEVLGCSLRTVDEYRKQGMPGKAPGRHGGQWQFDSGEVIGWLREKERTDALGEIADGASEDWAKRKLAAQALSEEHDLALKQGAAVAISDFEAAWAAMIGAARAKLLGLGVALGPDVALSESPLECSGLIDSAVKEALRELSEFSPDLQIYSLGDLGADESGEESGDLVGSTAEPKRKRVGRPRKTPQP